MSSSRFNTKHKSRMRVQKANRRAKRSGLTCSQINEARIRAEAKERRRAMALEAERERLADPRRPYYQYITNLLAARCFQDPAFRLLALQEVLRQMGVPFTSAVQIIDGVPVIVVETPSGATVIIDPNAEKIPGRGQGHLE